MASDTDNDPSGSSESESDDDSIFYDANSSVANADHLTPLQNEPRWRVPSKTTPPGQFFPHAFAENQIEEIERRDKLQRLRGQGKIDASPPMQRESTKKSSTSLTPDLLKDHLDHEKTKKPSNPNENLVDLSLIDRITRFGAFSPTSDTLGDEEILRQPIVRNLDNGKYIPLSDANPMTQTILERVQQSGGTLPHPRRSSIFKGHSLRRNSSEMRSQTKEINEENLFRHKRKSFSHHTDGDGEQNSSSSASSTSSQNTAISSSSATSKSVANSTGSFLQGGKRQLAKFVLRNFFRRNKKKTKDDEHDVEEDDDAERLTINSDLKYKASRHLREPTHFDKTQLLQTIGAAHDGPIWCMRFSPDGHLLATGGQDSLLKVWVLKCARPYFDDFSRLTNNASKQQNEILSKRFKEFHQNNVGENSGPTTINGRLGLSEEQAPLYSKAFCEFVGHQAPVLDVAWSKSLFLLSSSMDKTVRLWHLSRSECLCFFRHVDFVSAIAFHPRDDRYFVSASLDGHVRLWNIPDKRVVYWTLIPSQVSSQITAAQANLITAVNFCDDGRKVNVGTFDGRFILYTDSLQYDTVLNIGDKDGSRSHRSRKKPRRKPRKITGIESMNTNSSKVLITSNDSRIRLYDTRTRQIERKYRGYSNQSSQIRGTFSHDDQFIISGSEDNWFYIWKTEPDGLDEAFSPSSRKRRDNFDRAFERIQVHNSMVTSAIFAPNPTTMMEYFYRTNEPTTLARSRHILSATRQPSPSPTSLDSSTPIYVMVTADSKGQLKLLVNRLQR